MSIVTCAICDVEFEAKTNRAKYCSQRCKDKGKPSANKLTCAVCSGTMQQGTASLPQGQAVHNKCRAGAAGKHGKSGYRRGCRCDECREGARLDMKQYTAKVKARDGVSPTQKYRPKKATGQFCVVCNGEMKRVAISETPMHKECRQKPTKGKLHRRFQAKIDKAARGRKSNRVFVAGGCTWCGEYFVGVGSAASYCSDKCATSATFKKRSSGKTFKISPRKRREIYERDGWTCKLCSHPVSQTEHYLSDYAASLDHIIPKALQLVPDHSPANLRLVHRWCNSSRGDGSNMSHEEFMRRVQIKFGEQELWAA